MLVGLSASNEFECDKVYIHLMNKAAKKMNLASFTVGGKEVFCNTGVEGTHLH